MRVMSIEVENTAVSDQCPDPKVILEGGLGLKDASGLSKDLLQTLDAHDSIQIDAQNLSQLDISIIQVLISAQKYASQKNKIIDFSIPENSALPELLNDIGIVCNKNKTEGFAKDWLRQVIKSRTVENE